MAKELNKITNKSKTAKKSKKELSAKSRKKVSGGLKGGEARVKDTANRNAKTVLVDAASASVYGARAAKKTKNLLGVAIKHLIRVEEVQAEMNNDDK